MGSRVGHCRGIKAIINWCWCYNRIGYRSMLHIDLYVGELIIEAAQRFVQKRNLNQDISMVVMVAIENCEYECQTFYKFKISRFVDNLE